MRALFYAVGMGILTMPLVADAHHSTTMFDSKKIVRLTGVVRAYEWTNPHSWIRLTVPNANNTTTEWAIEIGSPALNFRHGWKKTSLRAGDRVTMDVFPLRNGQPGGTVATIKLPDGTELLGPQRFLVEGREFGGRP